MKQCFLLESPLPGYSNPVYVSVFGHMTSDPWHARRFETQQEAEDFKHQVKFVAKWQPVEHSFEEVDSGSQEDALGQFESDGGFIPT